MSVVQINKTCDGLLNDKKYYYFVNSSKTDGCDHIWKAPNGTVLKYGDVLTLDNCVNGIRHITRCFEKTGEIKHIFNVFSTSPSTVVAPYESGNSTQTHDSDPNLLWLILIGLILILLVLGFIEWRWKVLTRLKDRCCQHTDKEPRMDSDNVNHDEHKNGGVVNGEAIPLKNVNNNVNPDVGKQEENINNVHHEEAQPLQIPADESRVS
ncbi:uncharacterized protein LOC124381770 [Silurus meridionalis]|nr:uncharacterized protein LOC124381770 [Silurus meridionalis]